MNLRKILDYLYEEKFRAQRYEEELEKQQDFEGCRTCGLSATADVNNERIASMRSRQLIANTTIDYLLEDNEEL